jgi:hypothetical protein
MQIDLKDSVRSSADGGGAILLDLAGGTYFSVNRTGAAIWQALREGRQPAEIASTIAERYKKSLARVEHDVDAFVHELEAHGLVRLDR